SDLTNEEWERIAPLLPPQKPKVGRPASDHRRIVNGMLWVMRTGASWRRLPARYGSWRTVASRVSPGRKQGVCDPIFVAIQQGGVCPTAPTVPAEVRAGTTFTLVRCYRYRSSPRLSAEIPGVICRWGRAECMCLGGETAR